MKAITRPRNFDITVKSVDDTDISVNVLLLTPLGRVNRLALSLLGFSVDHVKVNAGERVTSGEHETKQPLPFYRDTAS